MVQRTIFEIWVTGQSSALLRSSSSTSSMS